MIRKLLLGPILGVESETLYTLIFVSHPDVGQTEVEYAMSRAHGTLIGEIPSGKVWRAELIVSVQPHSQSIKYAITFDNERATSLHSEREWTFYIPGQTESPQIAYASCNGFSDLKYMSQMDSPYQLWRDMHTLHAKNPFSLLIMGGDQVYADPVWTEVKSLVKWSESDHIEKVQKRPNHIMRKQLERFYNDLYLDRWNKPDIARMLATIPSVMMWDDHDIFDGYGSFPEPLQQSAVFKEVFARAKHYFTLFQIRGKQNTSLLAHNSISHFAFSFKFRDYHVVALDHRSERSLTQIMSAEQWHTFLKTLSDSPVQSNLLLLSAVPVVYRDFSITEEIFDNTPWQEELTDDLKDHWRAKAHQGERQKLIHYLSEDAKKRTGKSIILSGDVHLGALGMIRSAQFKIHQIISSGIVHPAPTLVQFIGIRAVTNDDPEFIDENKEVVAEMIKPHGSNQYIRARNFVTLQMGCDNKVWVNWITEHKDNPVFPIA